jgi:hypothetical protein
MRVASPIGLLARHYYKSLCLSFFVPFLFSAVGRLAQKETTRHAYHAYQNF